MLNKWTKTIIALFALMATAHCIHCGCVEEWRTALGSCIIALLLFILLLYDWMVGREMAATRRHWFRSGWCNCANTMDIKLLNRYRQLLHEEQSTTSPRVDEVNRIRVHTLGSLMASLKNRMVNDSFLHYENENRLNTEEYE